ncbi:IS3 family transposase [Corynebacterium flavescens]|nr:IS3 family transposase [Corynebacterium flavescens]
MGQRRRFTEEYRRDAASIVIDTGQTIKAVADQLGLGEQSLGKWVAKERARRSAVQSGQPAPADSAAEIARLRRQVAALKAENEFLGKASGLLRRQATTPERFELMAKERANYSIMMMARALEVSRAGFYAWFQRLGIVGQRQARRDDLDAQVRWFHELSRGTYGAPRITADLHAAGIVVDRKTVARSMRRQGLEGLSTRSFRVSGRRKQAECRHGDSCERTWDKGRLDAVWVTDFTYLRCGEGWVYLCAIRDGHSRRVLGFSMGPKQDTDLVVTALDKARALRGELPGQVVLHADRGTQFTSAKLNDATVAAGVRMSMGKTGVCWDNAMAESFWATLKVEYFYRHAFATRAEVYDGVSEWIEVFYNRYRRHSAIGDISPVAFELTLNQPAAALKAA